MKKLPIVTAFIFLLFSCSAPSSEESTKKPMTEIDQKVEELLGKMTLEEKVGQLNMYTSTWELTGPAPKDGNNKVRLDNIKAGKVGGMLNVVSAEATRNAQKLAVENSRLGIPLIFGYDVIHGYKTMFPIPLAQASSWNPELARKGNEVAAREATAAGLHWTFSPMVDVSQDARWGRIMEGAGEDPYLTSVMAEAWVKGYQGEDLADINTIAACAKHFAAYGFVQAGRDYNTVDISENTLFNVVLPPFKAASDAGVATFMNGFTDLNGIPVTGSKMLQREVLKGEWGFKGFVVSDWGSIGEMMTHGYTADSTQTAIVALEAGSDMDMEAHVYENFLEKAIKEGKVSEDLLNDAVRRILKVKFKLGLFDDPYRYSNVEREKKELLSEENLKMAREAAKASQVLLKNDNSLLPISESIKSIAVIGDLADSKDDPLGNWRGKAEPNSAVSLLEGIQNAVGEKSKVTFSEGYKLTKPEKRFFVQELEFYGDDRSGFKDAIALAKRSEVVIMAMGEDCYQSGEARSQVDIRLKGNQEDLLKEILKVNKNVVVVLMTGRPVAIPYIAENAPAILQSWHLGSEAGNAIADVLFGKYNPSGKLPVSFPRHTGQEPLYYYRKNTGRPTTNEWDAGFVFWSHYTDSPNSAQWPFGFGLSYTKFDFSDYTLSASKGQVKLSVKVSNAGDREGTETVQVYIRDRVASLTQPIKRLVAFEQATLKPGESKTIEFTLTGKDLGFYHADRTFYAEDGEFQIMVGPDSENLQSKLIDVKF